MNCKDNSKVFKVPVFTSTQDFKPSHKAKMNKKKTQYKNKRDSRDSGNSRDSNALVTGVNATEIGGKIRKKKDVSEITYYNYNKKRHFANKYLKPWKSKN